MTAASSHFFDSTAAPSEGDSTSAMANTAVRMVPEKLRSDAVASNLIGWR